MNKCISAISKQAKVTVIVANCQMDWWESDGGIKFFKQIGLKPGHRVLDFGCRAGHYTIPAAKVVGERGIVLAVDKEQQALHELEQKVKQNHLMNIRIINTEGQTAMGLENESVEVVLFYDVLHYFQNNIRNLLYHEALRVLKPNGVLSVYPKHSSEDSPAMEFRDLTIKEIQQEIQDSDFVFEKKYCGLISHDDSLTQACVFNFIKRKQSILS